MNYYNEHDPFAAEWLRALISAGLIPAGYVDERSIEDVLPGELIGYKQCHFFAGIGGWPLALRLAGVPDDYPIWTGSCPCQPFSTAGAGAGVDDPRHLWPHFAWLIRQCRPAKVAGEQVASKSGRAWFAGVRADLEALGYAVAGADLCAAGVGAPHIRQRLFWVADTNDTRLERHRRPIHQHDAEGRQDPIGHGATTGVYGGLDDPKSERPGFFNPENVGATDAQVNLPTDTGDCQSDQSPWERLADSSTGPTNGFWADADWLFCRDGKWRAVEPGTFPLAHGIPARVGRLRGYGNAIVPQVAAEFLRAAL